MEKNKNKQTTTSTSNKKELKRVSAVQPITIITEIKKTELIATVISVISYWLHFAPIAVIAEIKKNKKEYPYYYSKAGLGAFYIKPAWIIKLYKNYGEGSITINDIDATVSNTSVYSTIHATVPRRKLIGVSLSGGIIPTIIHNPFHNRISKIKDGK